ncbi:hypothetical protein PEP31012_03374 [Pandoraea eparura]|uniref:Uncharacterized protein n=1 Tax=Pandoraea eparura TaxID=2508291 RepID=A0A5E4WMP9_9BURK|nr:hypothetical protein [Pandoraea eparura]VVE25413.1 hypothetical protein PEP31012_03374 [Pandoraea eparura]
MRINFSLYKALLDCLNESPDGIAAMFAEFPLLSKDSVGLHVLLLAKHGYATSQIRYENTSDGVVWRERGVTRLTPAGREFINCIKTTDDTSRRGSPRMMSRV